MELDRKEMIDRISFVLLFVITIVFVSSVGCSSSATAPNSDNEARLKVVGILYGKYLKQSRGNASADQKQLAMYLESERPNWEKLAESTEQLLISPRDGKPLVLLGGKELAQQRSEGAFWVAYESEGINGKRQVVSARGLVEEMDEQKIEQVFPSNGK